MTVGQMIEMLSELPAHKSLELTKVISAASGNEGYLIRLDFPIIGLAEKDDDVVFVVEHTKEIIAFGTPQKLTP